MAILSTFKDEIDASDAVYSNMKDFAQYSALEIMPNYIDGLKLIHRRILWVLGTDETKKKCSALTGNVMDKVHPHGDSGITDAIIRLAQPFSQCLPLVHAAGSFGAYGGGDAAAGRYLNVKSAPFARDLFFNKVNTKTLTYVPSETGVGVEPAFLVPILPTSLLMGAFTIAVGFKSHIPYYNLNNVCGLVEEFIRLRKQYPFAYYQRYADIAKYCVPDYPTHSLLRNEDTLLAKYSQGDYTGSSICDGLMDVYPNKINIHTIPYGRSFEGCYQTLLTEFKKPSFVSANVQEITELTTGWEYGDLELTLKRGVNPFDILDELKRTIRFTASISHIWNFTDHEGTLSELNPMSLLELWYRARHRSILADLKSTNSDLFRLYRKLSALIIIADHTNTVLSIIKGAESRNAAIAPLRKRFKLTAEQAEYVTELPLYTITKQSKDDLLKRLAVTKEKIAELQTRFANIDDTILADVQFIRKTYGTQCPRRTVTPKFIGAILIRELHGCIQYTSLHEMTHLVKRWNTTGCEIMLYPAGEGHTILTNNGTIVTDELALPKEFVADKLQFIKHKPKHTILLKSNDVLRFDGVVTSKSDDVDEIYISNTFVVVHESGIVETLLYSDITKRRATTEFNTIKKNDIVYVSNIVCDDFIVASTTDKELNTVHFDRITKNGKINKYLLGTMRVIGIWKTGEPIAVSMPANQMSRCTVKHIYLWDCVGIMGEQTRTTLYLNRKTFSTGQSLVELIKGGDVYSDRILRGQPKE